MTEHLQRPAPFIKNSSNYLAEFDTDFETNTMVSETIPGQSMTVKEHLDRFDRGQSVMGNSGEPQYYEDELPNLEIMDLEDMRQLALENQQLIAQAELENQKIRAEEHRRKLKADLRKEIEEEDQKNILDKPLPPEGGGGGRLTPGSV